VNRAMPFGNAQSLSSDEMYALTAYILYLNDIVDDDEFELSNKNFTSIRLPNEKNFIKTRGRTRRRSKGEPCMKDCKAEVKITGVREFSTSRRACFAA
jgi:hypothetical protein